jgi:hypothetical protein
MRAGRWIVIATVVGAVLSSPAAARADGGAYIEFDRTHYLPGETATGEAYVYLQKQHQGLLEKGPFYAYLLTDGGFVERGHPVPAGAIRLGTFAVEESRPKWFELKVSFTVPDLTGDFYPVGVCNDPCTIWGFKEPLSGLISVVQTAREGALLTQRQRLYGRIYAIRRQVKKGERALAELGEQFDASDRVRSAMASEMSLMEDHLAAATAAAAATREGTPRPLLTPAIGITLVLLLLVLTAVVAARGRLGPKAFGGATGGVERRGPGTADQARPVLERRVRPGA